MLFSSDSIIQIMPKGNLSLPRDSAVLRAPRKLILRTLQGEPTAGSVLFAYLDVF
jgi:hypothetical protein